MSRLELRAIIDWLSDGLCTITERWDPQPVHHDRDGQIRVLAAEVPYERFVGRAFDKIRQAGRGMPAVMIRQLDTIAKIMNYATPDHRDVLLAQAAMILRSSEESVPEPDDRADVRRSYDAMIASCDTART